MSKAKQIRVLVLLLILAPLTFLLFMDFDPRPDWERTLIVGIYPDNADGSASAAAMIATLQSQDFLATEDYFAVQARHHGLNLELPFELRLGDKIDQSPPPPPAEHLTRYRLRWAAQLRWWHFRLNRQGLEPDIVLVLRFHSGDSNGRLHSIGMAQPRLGLINLSANPDLYAYNQVVIAHELLHTVGASDLYAPNFAPSYPEGYAEPDREPRYPQTLAELMAMRIPLTPQIARPPMALDETQVGQHTAREIGWQ
ncbi:MAG: hypothetical protein ACXIUL_04770 [Wenzhouxiangella sp.]